MVGLLTVNVYTKPVADTLVLAAGSTDVGAAGVPTPAPLTIVSKLLAGTAPSKPEPKIVRMKVEGEVMIHDDSAMLPSPTHLLLLHTPWMRGVKVMLNWEAASTVTPLTANWTIAAVPSTVGVIVKIILVLVALLHT